MCKTTDVLKHFAEQVERLAFEMPAPNKYTPQFVQLAQTARLAIREDREREVRDEALRRAHGKLLFIAATEMWADVNSNDGWLKSPGDLREYAEIAASEIRRVLSDMESPR